MHSPRGSRNSASRVLSQHNSEVASWCASRRLQLNADKTEVICFGSKSNLAKLRSSDSSLSVGRETVQPVSVVRDLGVLLDAELSMRQHVNKVAAISTTSCADYDKSDVAPSKRSQHS